MNAVVAEEDRRRFGRGAAVAGKLRRIGKARPPPPRQRDNQRARLDRVPGGVHVGRARERRRFVQERPPEGDDRGAPRRIVASVPFGAGRFGYRIGAVEGVVEAPPARVGGVEGIARIGQRHDELRAREGRDLRVHALGRDRERVALRDEVADLREESPIGGGIRPAPGRAPVPGVDLLLQPVALGQEGAVLRPQAVADIAERLPEARGRHAGARQRLALDEVVQRAGDLEAAGLDRFRQGLPPRYGCTDLPRCSIRFQFVNKNRDLGVFAAAS